jgi:hypothetical protein
MTIRLAQAKALSNRNRGRSNVITSDRVVFEGGLNLIDSAEGISPGELLGCRNYEPHFVTGA